MLNPLLHLLLHSLIRVHNSLLVDHNLSGVSLWSANARCDGRRVGLNDNAKIQGHTCQRNVGFEGSRYAKGCYTPKVRGNSRHGMLQMVLGIKGYCNTVLTRHLWFRLSKGGPNRDSPAQSVSRAGFAEGDWLHR